MCLLRPLRYVGGRCWEEMSLRRGARRFSTRTRRRRRNGSWRSDSGRLKRSTEVDAASSGDEVVAMDNERIRAICFAMPHVAETVGWGHHLVYWVGDREIGGKMFASTDLDGSGVGVLAFHCGAERFHELLEKEGTR